MSVINDGNLKKGDTAVKRGHMTFFICLGLTIFFLIFSLPLSYIAGNGVSKATSEYIGKFLHKIVVDPSYLFKMYGRWFHQITNYHGDFSLALWIPILPFIIIPVGLIISTLFGSKSKK